MLTRRDEQHVIEVLRPIMAATGFQRRESTWYRFSSQTIQILNIQGATSPSKQRLYVNLGATFRDRHPPTHLQIFDCIVYGRLDHIVPNGESFSAITDFSDVAYSNDERCRRIADLIQRFALPLLDSWQSTAGVRAFAESDQSKGFILNPAMILHE